MSGIGKVATELVAQINKLEQDALVTNETTQAVSPVEMTALAVDPSKQQTLTILFQAGKLDLMSERNYGNQWRRSITIQPENLEQLIKALQAVQKAGRAGKHAATVTIRNGVILK